MNDERRSRLAALHCAKRDLGLDDDAYRAMLTRLTGKESAADLSATELGWVLADLRDKGWKGGRSRRQSPPSRHKTRYDKTQADKIRALWINMGRQGIVRNPAETALNRYVKRMTGVEHVEWLDVRQAGRVIEALKSWRAREEEA